MEKRCPGCMRIKTSSPICEHCGYNENIDNLSHQLPIGTVLRDQYRVGKVLGQGGFGITYIGWDMALENPVAIKEYYPNSVVKRECVLTKNVTSCGETADLSFRHNRERFLREGRTLARLGNIPGIVRVYNLFEANNTAYIVMEYVRGIDLRSYIQMNGGHLGTEKTFSILWPVMTALDQVHGAELVHRDISPDNIMLLPDGSAKLLDFGAAREVVDADAGKDLAQSTEAILKHGFAPMEQYQKRGSLGPWTDVYAMCATIYYCLTGELPPDAPARMMEDIHPDWEKVPGLTEQQRAALERGMRLRAKDRISTMKELQDALFGQIRREVSEEPEYGEEKPRRQEATVSESTSYPSYIVPLEERTPEEKQQEQPMFAYSPTVPVDRPGPETLYGQTVPAAPPVPEPSYSKTAAVTQPMEEKKIDQKVTVAVEEMERTRAVVTEKPKKKGGKLLPIAAVLVCVIAAAVLLWKPGAQEQESLSAEAMAYAAAEQLLVDGETARAAIAFGKLGDYEDARERSFELWRPIAKQKIVSAGEAHTASLKADGTVAAVGSNNEGQCNVSDWRGIVAVSASDSHTVGLKADGTVMAVGNNDRGECDVSEWTDIAAISAGFSHTVGIKADGTAVVSGDNAYGACNVSDWMDIVAVSTYGTHTVGLKADGTVMASGLNRYGQCHVSGWTDIVAVSAGGDYTVGLKADGTVVTVGEERHGKCDVSEWTDIVSVSAGDNHTVGLKADGTVVASGFNMYGQCNVSDWTDIVAVSAGNDYTVGLKTDGTLVAVGRNDSGQCSVFGLNGFKVPASAASQVENEDSVSTEAMAYAEAEQLLSDGEIARAAIVFGKLGDYEDARERSFELWWEVIPNQTVSVGEFHTVGLKADGTVVAVGRNWYGERNVSDWTDIVAISAGDCHTVGLKADGTVVAEGVNQYGQCDVSNWTDIVAVSADGFGIVGVCTLGLKADGTAMISGYRVDAVYDVSDWRDIEAVSAGENYIVGLKADGTVVASGYGDDGRCAVSDWRDIVAVSAGAYHTVGLKADGTVVAMGNDEYGQCDVSDWTDIRIPGAP